MSKAIYNIEDNEMDTGEAFVSMPNNFSGELNVKRNKGRNIKYGVFVRDDATLETILLKHLKADTPPEKITEVITALKGLEVQDEDTIYEKLRSLGLKTYVEVGITLGNLASALLPLYTG